MLTFPGNYISINAVSTVIRHIHTESVHHSWGRINNWAVPRTDVRVCLAFFTPFTPFVSWSESNIDKNGNSTRSFTFVDSTWEAMGASNASRSLDSPWFTVMGTQFSYPVLIFSPKQHISAVNITMNHGKRLLAMKVLYDFRNIRSNDGYFDDS